MTVPAADANARTMLDEALDYLALKYPIFPVCSPLMGRHPHAGQPCTSPGKRPLVAWEAFQTRLPTTQEVRSWWTRWPAANIGMATGALSGVVVLDCDSGEARQLAMERGGLDRTPAVWTGKPGGVHYWLAHPGEDVRNFARKLPGTDARGDGGYVLLPPSRHALGANYRWNEHTLGMRPAPIPEWLLELMRGGSGSGASPEGADGEPLDLDAILRGIGEGARDDTLWRYACKMRGDDVPQAYAEQMIRQAARLCRPPFDEDMAVEKVRRAYREFQPRVERDFSEWFEEEAEAAAETAETKAAEEPAPLVFSRPISELLAMPDVDPDWMVDQLFTVASNGWIGAEPKVGKSWVALELAYSLSTGVPFLGRFAVRQPRRVLYLQEEDSAARVKRRLRQIIIGDPSRLAPPDAYFRYVIRQGFKVDNLAWIEILKQEIISYRPEVILMDVFNRLHGSDENKQAEMTAILNVLTALTNAYGCSFLVVHHNRKPQVGDEARGNQRIRGSGVLGGWGECSLYLRRGKEKDTIIITPESKDAPETDDILVTIEDQPNGGVILQAGEVEATSQMPKGDRDVMESVARLVARGIGATVRAVSDDVGKDRSTVQARLKRLTQAGYLNGMPISDEPFSTILYTVASR